MKKTYATPTVTSNGDFVRETRNDAAVATKTEDPPEVNLFHLVDGSFGFYL